jgi:hypothetical protein
MRRAIPFTIVSAFAATALAVLPARPAAAVVSSTDMLVTYQDGGAACASTNQQVQVVNGVTGAAVSGGNLGKPSNVSGVLQEAKPFDRNKTVVALWGRTSWGGTGGVGEYTRTSGYSGSWTTSFPLPTSFQWDDNTAHSVTKLPDGYFAVAQVGTVTGWSYAGFVVVFDRSGNIVDHEQIDSAHGVEWDPTRDAVFVSGYKDVRRYSYDRAAHNLTLTNTYQFPPDGTPAQGGHDIRRRRMDNKFFVTTNLDTYLFNPDLASGWFSPLTNNDGSALPDYVKSVDQGFDGLVEYGLYPTAKFFYLDGHYVNGPACMATYKERWIWGIDTAVYPEDDVAQSTTPADPFIYTSGAHNNELLTGNEATTGHVTDPMWIGHGAGQKDPTTAKTQVASAVANGKTPYVFFYYWGDGNDPNDPHGDPNLPYWHKMGQVENARQDEIDDWYRFATNIGQGLGDSKGYVVVENEWDVTPISTHACSANFLGNLPKIIQEIRRWAKNVTIVNSPGLYDGNNNDYNCFTAGSSFDLHGFSLMEVNGTTYCATKANGQVYSSKKMVVGDVHIVADVTNMAARMKTLFGANEVLLSDLAVTSCGWGASGQASIFQNLSDNLDDLYDSVGLRGVVIRTAGPSAADSYTGVQNEAGFAWGTGTSTAIASGRTTIQAKLASISINPTPTFTETATATPPNVAPGGTTSIRATVTNDSQGLSNGEVDVDIYDSGGTRLVHQVYTGQNMTVGSSYDYPFDWVAPMPNGVYTVRVYVYSSTGTQLGANTNAATVTVGMPDPSFTATTSASPSSVAEGGSTTLTATVTNNGGALTNGQVEVTVTGPSGTNVGGEVFTGQNIGAGVTAPPYTVSWTAPMAAGTYTIGVIVSGAGGTPRYTTNTTSGTVTVGSTQFTSSVSATHLSVAPGYGTTITTKVNATGGSLSNGIVVLEIYDATGARVVQQSWSGQNIASGSSGTYNYTWTAPSTTGTYQLKVGVFTSGWASTLHWNDRAGTINVAPLSFSTDASSSPTTVAPGGSTTITVTATTKGGGFSNGVLDVEIFNSSGTRVTQQFWSSETFTSGTTDTRSFPWTAPATLGTYTVKIGVMGPGWTPTIDWNNNGDVITVANPSFTGTASVSSATVTPGSNVDITATFTSTGGAIVGGHTDIEVYNSAGVRYAQQTYTDSIADGASVTHTYTWPSSPTPGTYTVKLGVMSPDWATTYYWNSGAVTISDGGSFQPSFTIGSGANAWWVEVYTSNDVTGVDAIGKDGAFYLPLVKKSWGAWAATAPSALANGDHVQFIARRSSDGSSAGSTTFGWLTQSPATEAGWACACVVGSGASTTWMEASVAAGANTVDVKVNAGPWTALTYSPTSGKWGKAMNTAVGAKVVFRATKLDGAKAYSAVFNWLQ